VNTKVEEMLRAGITLSDIETELKMTHIAVKQIADEIGWDISWRKDKYDKHTEKYDTIADLIVNEKLTLREVGDRFGVSRERVRQILEDMDIHIRDNQREAEAKIKGRLFDLLLTGEYTLKDVSNELGVSYGVVDRVVKTLTPSQVNRYRSHYITREFYKTKEAYMVKMKIALELWETDKPLNDIATDIGIDRAYLNQIIIKCRKRYGWFPAKYAARFEPTNDTETIKELIRKDRAKRDPKLADQIKEEKRKAKAEAKAAEAEAKAVKAAKAEERAKAAKVRAAKAEERVKAAEAKAKAAKAEGEAKS
jgi:AraC-like DNA-binding protein